MKIAVVRETREAEHRVAASPETVKKFVGIGATVTVEAGAGAGAQIADSAFEAEGATIASDRAAMIKDADVVLSVRGLDEADAGSLKADQLVLGVMNPYQEQDRIETLAKSGARMVALEFVPRITRAQSMDVLSSQSNLAGYKAVLDAVEYFGRALPMMMTAAGTIAPAKVLIMGAGVAGLQAIATAKRLGAVVSATDVRLAAKEQVQSLGANFVMVEDDEAKEAETSGGYAKEMSDEYKAKQAALIAETIKKQDIVITTALIPGRAAPVLVTDDMLSTMGDGSVLVDLAVEQGGNVEGSAPGQVVEKHGVKIVGHLNVPSRLARDASNLFAKNLFNYLSPHVAEGVFTLDLEDEIVTDSVIAQGGAITHPRLTGDA